MSSAALAQAVVRSGRGRCAGLLAICAGLLATLLFAAADLSAANNTSSTSSNSSSLYTARVPVKPNNPQSRENAYKAALSQILLRMTGSQNALMPEQIEEWFPNPARYVMQYRPGEDNTLWVTLDGNAIERVLREAGQTIWGGDRPLTLVWLAVDWGEGEREIIAADDPERSAAESRSIDRNRRLRERVQEIALERGVPVAFPLMDAEELQKVSFSDIWGGFNDSLLEASRRYGSSSVLVGRIRPDSAQRNRWSYFFGDERREWSGEPEEAINLLADTLAAQFSIAGNAPLEAIDLTVSGISSLEAYGAVHSFMQSLNLIEELAIDSASGDRLRYRVKAHGGQERLQRALQLSTVLEPANDFGSPAATRGYRRTDSELDAAPAALEYRYRP